MPLAALVLGAALAPGGLIAWLVVGLLAGFLASTVMRGGGYGMIGDIIVGVVGAFLGGFVMNLLTPDATYGFGEALLLPLLGPVS